MSAQHTPGPWQRSESAARFACGENRPQAEIDANARLIAAAPELLAALKQLRREVAEMTARVGWAGNGGREMADAAIAKVQS